MAEAVAGSLVYQFKADIADLKNGFANIQTELSKVKSGIGTVNDNFKSVGKGASESIGLARHEMINLSRQVADVGVSLASGQSPFMVLIQQGAQIKDVFSSSKATFAGLAAQFITVGNIAKIAALGIVSIGAAAYSSLSNLEKLSETAKTLGTNTQALRGFNRQASILGVDPKELNEQMVALAQRIREAQTSGGELAEKLGRIGINIKSFDLSKPGEFARLFAEIAEKVRNGSNEIDKLNALKLIGFSSEMLRVFSEGGAAIDTFVNKSRDAAENSTTPIRDKWKELRTLWDEIANAIGQKSIDIISSIVDFVKDAINQINSVIDYVKSKFNELTTFKFSDEKGMVTNGAGSLSNYENRLGLQDKQKLPDININAASKPKSVDLSGIYSLPKSKMDKGVGSQVDPLKSYIDSLKEAAAVSKAEADNWALGNVEKAKAEALAKANVIASREGKTLTDGMRDTITQYATGAAQAKLQVDNLRTAQQGLNQLMSQFADTAINAFDGLMDRSKRITDVLRDLVKMLANNALKGALTGDGAFGQMMGLGGKNGNTGGILGMLGGAAKSMFAGYFAEGGSIPSGKWGIAGEAGPELIQGPANIIPMNNNGGSKITIHNYANAEVDARQMSDGQIIVTVQKMIKDGLRQVPNIMAEAQRRSI
jgi:hypothetical protein